VMASVWYEQCSGPGSGPALWVGWGQEYGLGKDFLISPAVSS